MKNWAQLLLCLILSSSIWLIVNLTQDYTDVVGVSVIARSNLDGRASTSTEPEMIMARVKADGFRLLGLEHSKRSVVVNIRAEDFTHASGDSFQITAEVLSKYVPEIFGDDVMLENFIDRNMGFSFKQENCVKVPVKAVKYISYKPQYMSLGEMRFTPDSVYVYGGVKELEDIHAVFTSPITHTDVSRDVKGMVRLECPSGLRLSVNDAAYDLDVTRYVELRSTVNIVARNVPRGVNFSVYPSSASVVFRCVFPTKEDPSEPSEFYVDYHDFQSSRTGSCMIHSEGVPGNVIDYRIEPEVCDCMTRARGE